MLVKQAKEMASRWVTEQASKEPAFFGAFLLGSVVSLPDEMPFPSSSDVDVKLILADPNPPKTFEHVLYDGIVLEVSYDSSDHYKSPGQVLSSYPLANHFVHHNIVVDPSGQLTKIQTAVAVDYPKRLWVRKRCEDARDWLLTSLGWLNEADPILRQVFAWLYPIPTVVHVLLMADLRNPTVRRSLVVSKEILDRYGYSSLHESVLANLGSVHMTREQVEVLLSSCTEVFEIAKHVVRTPFFQSSKISDSVRPIAIGGSRELIESGFHREAVFWITFIHHVCQTAVMNDAPVEVREQLVPTFERLLSELGVASFPDRQRRNNELKALVPRVWEVAEVIMATNPDIVD